MRITKLSIKDSGGITIREADIAPAGAIVRGKNGAGKTSVLRALAAALTGDGANADSVRLDADRAEITIDTDTHRIRRVIKRSGGGEVEATNADGDRKAKPVAWLRAQFGAVDPLHLVRAKPSERRAMILGAVPATVTAEQLRAWAPGLPADFSAEGHGFDVIERARELFYARRTAANAKATTARIDADRAAAAVPAIPSDALTLDRAQIQADRARHALAELRARQEQHAVGERKAAATRDRITELRSEAERLRSRERELGAQAVDVAGIEEDAASARQNIARLEGELAEWKRQLASAEKALVEANRLKREEVDTSAAGDRASDQAADLEATLAALSVPVVPFEELERAAKDEARAQEALEVARAADAALTKAQRAKELADVAQVADRAAGELDAIVRRLTKDAPAELLAAANGPAGLTLDGDTVRLDGVSLDDLCGQEKMSLALRIAKRLSAAKVLLVDGLEALDPDQREAFVAEATADGFQLLGTLVDRGEVVFCAIEATPERSAAE